MNFSSFVALRFLSSSRQQSFVSWITTLSILGIAIGVATMIIVLSVINGFETELRNRFLAANAHVLMYRYPAGMSHHDRWEESVRSYMGNEVTGLSPFIHAETMARKDGVIHAVLVRGIDPAKRQTVQDLTNIVRPKEALNKLEEEMQEIDAGRTLPDLPSIIVGIRLLESMNAKVGETIELIAPQAENADDPFGEVQRFKIAGVYDSGLQHYDVKLVILSIPAAQRLFGMKDIVTGLEIGLKDPNRSPELSQRLDQHYNLTVKEWQSYNHNIFEAMRTERLVIALIVALVAFVASFNILTTLIVSVSQKQREISLFRSLGAHHRQILYLFVKQGTLMGTIGGVLGSALAYVLAYVIEHYRIIDLPDIYLLAKLPVQYDWRIYLAVAGGGILIASLAGLYPAWVATRVSPTQGLMANVTE